MGIEFRAFPWSAVEDWMQDQERIRQLQVEISKKKGKKKSLIKSQKKRDIPVSEGIGLFVLGGF